MLEHYNLAARCKALYVYLIERGWPITILNGRLTTNQRMKGIDKFNRYVSN